MKKGWRIALKIGLVALLSVVLYIQITQNQQLTFAQWWQGLQGHWSWSVLPWAIFMFFLVVMNWSLETAKWIRLMRPLEEIPFRRAFRAVLAGVTFSLFTPNRIGEYAGRVLLVKEGQRGAAVWATLTGSLAQWMVLWMGGLLSASVFCFLYWQELTLSTTSLLLLGALGLGVMLLLLSLYFGMKIWMLRLKKWRWTSRWATYLWQHSVSHYNRSDLLYVWAFSALRYFVYSFQYYLLLVFWGYNIAWWDAALAISLVFCLQTGIPIPPATGLVIRGNIALWVFGFFASGALLEQSSWSLLSAAWSLWLINVILPGLVGGAVILGIRGRQ